ncbi:hypothetical protein ABPG72_017260 [Tetrahymena utriculariae]
MDINQKNIVKYSAYLAFYINYCLMIPEKNNRDEYLEKLCKIENAIKVEELNSFINDIQDFFLWKMNITEDMNIVKNISFKENALLFFFCIINKIPACLIGPPGSSKSLSLKYLISSMQGKSSKDEFLKQYPNLIPIYYQGHTQTKSEKVVELFQEAEKRQQNLDKMGQQNSLAVICFEEIGLAEISPDNPLKVLHEQLEKIKYKNINIFCKPSLIKAKKKDKFYIKKLLKDSQNFERFGINGDSENKKLNYIEEKYSKILKFILRIDEKNNQVEQQQFYLIRIYLVWYIWRQQIEVIGKIYLNFKRLLKQEDILQKCNIQQQNKISEQLEQLSEQLIRLIYDSIRVDGNAELYNILENNIYELQNVQIKNNQINKILEYVQLINHINNNFQGIREIVNLISQINVQDLIKLDQQQLEQAKNLLNQSYQNLNKNKLEQDQIKRNFDMKWNQLMKKLIILSIQNGQSTEIEPKFIHQIFELEKNDDNMVKNTQFQIFLHRVFFLLRESITIENQLKVFHNSSNLFTENILHYKQQINTFVAYGQILQNKLYKKFSLEEICNKSLDDILIKNTFNQLNILQQTIYLSCFKVIVEKIVDQAKLEERQFTKKESTQEQEIIQNVSTLDKQIIKYFSELNEQAFQLFIVKQLFYKEQLKNLQKLYYFKNCKWLQKYTVLQQYDVQQKINMNRYDLHNEQNVIEHIKQMIQSNIQSSNNIFKSMYGGVINDNQVYPFNMKHPIESEIDLYNTNILDATKNLYQCLRCDNFIVFNINEKFQATPRCSYCQIDLNSNDKQNLKLVLEDLSNKELLLSKINIKKGFCLHLSDKECLKSENLDINNFCKALFALVYFCIFDLSLKQKNSPFNNKVIVKQKDTSKGQLQNQEMFFINQVLLLDPQKQAKDCLNQQIQLALNIYYQYTEQKLYVTQKKSWYVLHDMVKYILSLNLEQTENLNNSQSLNLKITTDIQTYIKKLNDNYSDLFLVLEQYKTVHYQIEEQLIYLPKSLKFSFRYVDNQIAYEELNKQINKQIKRQNIIENFPILKLVLDILNDKIYAESLDIFIKFYHHFLNLFSFRFEYSKIQNKTFKQHNQENNTLNEDFATFIQKYNNLIKQIKSKSSNNDIQNINEINEDTILLDLLYTNQNKPTNFFILLNYLCEYQNKQIEQLQSLCQKKNNNSNVQKLYQELKVWLSDETGQIGKKPLQCISISEVIKAPDYQNFELFATLGFEEGDGIKDNFIFDFDSLQYELIKATFMNVCLIDIEKTAQLQFLDSLEQIVKQKFNYFQELQPDQILYLDQISIEKDNAFDILQQITTAQKLINFDQESELETLILSAMESLRIRFYHKKISQFFEQLKDLIAFTNYIQDKVMDKLVNYCDQTFRSNSNLQNIETFIQNFAQNQRFLKELRKIIGRFIIKVFSQDKISYQKGGNLIQSLKQEKIIQNDHQVVLEESSKILKIEDCFLLFEKIQLAINDLGSQEAPSQSQHNQRPLIEEGRDD